jgi:excisionase family DNA binding protein
MTTPPPVNDLALYRIPQVMTLLNLSRSTIYELLRTGRLRAVNQGRARRIPASAIRSYIALLEAESSQSEAA